MVRPGFPATLEQGVATLQNATSVWYVRVLSKTDAGELPLLSEISIQ